MTLKKTSAIKKFNLLKLTFLNTTIPLIHPAKLTSNHYLSLMSLAIDYYKNSSNFTNKPVKLLSCNKLNKRSRLFLTIPRADSGCCVQQKIKLLQRFLILLFDMSTVNFDICLK